MTTQTRSANSRIRFPLRVPSGPIVDRARNDACRLDFVSFIEAVFNLLNPSRLFLMNWHIARLAYCLEQVRLGRIRRLIINLPPRFLKSIISSIAFPAFVLGHDPTRRLVVISYGLDLAGRFAYQSHRLMSSDLYKRIFPGTRIARNAGSEIVTTRDGYRFGTSLDGSVTGRGGDIIIIDDPLKLSDAESDIKREHVNETYREIPSRLDDNENGAIVIVMQRLHPDDLCGTVLRRSDDWTVLRLPLIAERDESIQIGDNSYHLRRVGDLLHPEYFSQRVVDERRSELDEKTFAAHYQQDPLQPLGVMIKRDTIRRYDQLPIRKQSHRVIQSWDTAIKVGAASDFSACVTLLVDEDRNQPNQRTYYVLEVLRGRFLYAELKARAITQAKKYRPDTILVEEAGLLGRTLIKDLKAAALPALGVIPEGDKPTRVSLQLEKFANRQVFLPREAPWLVDFENEIFAFPNGRYDDQVDALFQALAHARPAYLWDDAALKGLEDFTNALWLMKMRGF
jgi:predicted phage terminase large subunit-like protein